MRTPNNRISLVLRIDGEAVPVTMHAATAELAISESAYGRRQHSVPLTLALEYARRHRAELERTFSAEPLFQQWLGAL